MIYSCPHLPARPHPVHFCLSVLAGSPYLLPPGSHPNNCNATPHVHAVVTRGASYWYMQERGWGRRKYGRHRARPRGLCDLRAISEGASGYGSRRGETSISIDPENRGGQVSRPGPRTSTKSKSFLMRTKTESFRYQRGSENERVALDCLMNPPSSLSGQPG